MVRIKSCCCCCCCYRITVCLSSSVSFPLLSTPYIHSTTISQKNSAHVRGIPRVDVFYLIQTNQASVGHFVCTKQWHNKGCTAQSWKLEPPKNGAHFKTPPLALRPGPSNKMFFLVLVIGEHSLFMWGGGCQLFPNEDFVMFGAPPYQNVINFIKLFKIFTSNFWTLSRWGEWSTYTPFLV